MIRAMSAALDHNGPPRVIGDFTGAALWMLAAAKLANPKGAILAISYVAGVRRNRTTSTARQKAGWRCWPQGMTHDLAATGPDVIAVKPDFVITPGHRN